MAVLNRKPNLIEKVNRVIFVIIFATILIAIIFSLINQRWINLLISFLALILIFLPYMFEKRYQIDLPVEFEFAIVLFVYGSLFLGEVQGFYLRYWWWDIFLHGLAGVALAFIGFVILFILYRKEKIRASPWIVAIFTLAFGLALGALWEIFEFMMDQLFGFSMQKSGLIDTMGDLLVDFFGALFVSIIGFLYIRYGKLRIFDRVMKRFRKDNPKLFGKV